MSSSLQAYKVHVEGRVQGVGFRYYTEKEAKRLGITGWVRNCADGSVEAMICGSEEQVNAMLTWLRHGPSSAEVTQTLVIAADSDPIPDAFRISH